MASLVIGACVGLRRVVLRVLESFVSSLTLLVFEPAVERLRERLGFFRVVLAGDCTSFSFPLLDTKKRYFQRLIQFIFSFIPEFLGFRKNNYPDS